MPVVRTRSVFSGIPVAEAMRRRIVSLPCSADIGQGIRMMIRHKINAVLLTEESVPCGVVSKTDLMSAFYAEFPQETPLCDVMGNQPIACFPDGSLEEALEIMEAAGVHRLYVTGANREEVIGAVSYAEIVGLLYRYCRACERGTAKKRERRSEIDPSMRLIVREVMTTNVWACRDNDPLSTVIDTLSAHSMGAVLIQDRDLSPVGAISKTDLIIAFHHGLPLETSAHEIMSTPAHSVSADERLSSAIQQMLVNDVQRLFVRSGPSDPDEICGVLALSDAARFRSGSCRACTAGRMLTR